MTQMVTRCPKCATAFRITSTQLESAKGAVRCGSCLHIFKAQDYLVKSAAPETATPKPVAVDAEKREIPIEVPIATASKPETLTIATPVIAPSKIAKPITPAAPKLATPQIDIPEMAKPVPVEIPKAAKPAEIQSNAVQAKAPSALEPERASSAAKPVIDKAKALEDEDDVLISDDMDKQDEKASTYEFDGFLDLNMHPKQTISLFEREIRYESLNEDDDKEEADESWAEDLIDDDEETLHQLKKAPPPLAPVTAPVTATASESTLEHTETANESGSSYSGPIFSLVSETAEEPRVGHEEPQPKHNQEHNQEHDLSDDFLHATRAPEAAPTESASAFAAALFGDAESDDDDVEEKTPSKRPVKSSKIRAFDTSRAALLMNIMPAPVEFTAKRMRRWYQQKLWPTLSILMAAVLFFQVAYFKFDYFSRVEPSRTAYLFTCPLFGCEVPSLVDTTLVEATNLIVRNHPEVANALLVDAILINKAPFEQPFPNLILSFSKIDDTLVASRLFTANEYLFGELAGMKYIPMNQPVHITLEISDPGADAPNYSLITH